MFKALEEMEQLVSMLIAIVVGALGYGVLLLVTPLEFNWFGLLGNLFNLLKEVI